MLVEKYKKMSIELKATLWFTFCLAVQKGVAVITTPVFTRLMSTEQYGQYSVFNSWLQIFSIITTLKLTGAVFNKGMSKYKNGRDAYTSTMQTVTLIITAIVTGIYLIFRKYVNDLTELPTFIMLAMFLELMVDPAVNFWTLRKRYEYQYKVVVIRTVSYVVINAVMGIIVVMMSEEKGYARILSSVVVSFVFGLMLFVANLSNGKTVLKKEYAVFAITFNLPLLLHYFSQYVLDQFDRIMIQKMDSVSAAGKYSVAYSAGALLMIIIQGINSSLVPWQYKKLEEKNFKKLDDVLFQTYVIILGTVMLFSAFAPEVMKLLAGPKYYQAVYVVPPVALGMLFLHMYTAVANVEFFYGLNKFTMYISMAGAGLNVVLNYVFIKRFGYVAAAYTTLFCYIIFAFSHYVYVTRNVKKIEKIDKMMDSKRIVLLSAISVVYCVGISLIYDNTIARLAIITVISIVIIIKRKAVMGLFSTMKKRND